jgi:signal transduction histidine kinase
MTFLKRIPYRSIGLYLLKVLALAVIYRLAAVLGLSMAYAQANASPVWPPTGIALAALLLFGLNLWPGVALGVLIGSLLTGAPPLLAFGMALGNTLEAVVGVLLLKHLVKFQNTIERLQDVVGLILVSGLSTTISASLGTLAVIASGNAPWLAFGNIWVTWWIGDLLGALVVAPLLLTWVASAYRRPKWREAIEGAILFILLSVLAVYVFSNQPPMAILHQALLYVVFPLMIWAALRFGQRGTSLGIVLVSGIAIWGTIHNNGPFALESMNDSLILLQTFTGVVSITSLVLAAVTAERRKATETIQRRYADLSTLNNATRSFLGNLDNVNIFQMIADMAVHQLGLNAAWVESISSDEADSQVLASKGITDVDIRNAQTNWKTRHPIGSPQASRIIFPPDGRAKRKVAAEKYRVQGIFPLAIGNQPLGFLNVLSTQKSFFTSDRQLLIQSFTNLAAVAIQNNYLFDSVRKGNEQLHALSQRLMKAQEDERLHLSRELHDESGQLLAAMMVQLGVLEHDATRSKEMAKRVQELKRITTDIQTNLHKLAVNLRPASLDHLGLVTTLQQYVADFSRQHGIKVDFEAVGLERSRLPIEVETAVFRIVQESLTNVILHAKATRIDVLLSRRNGRLVAVVEDDGIGFMPTSPDVGEHIGLFGMRERIEMLGGAFTIETAPGKGTTVKVEVPCGD